MLWNVEQVRLLFGEEMLSAQTYWIDDLQELRENYSDSFVQDLAGNAFSTTQCSAAMMLAFVGCALAEQYASQLASAAGAACVVPSNDMLFSFDPELCKSEVDSIDFSSVLL